MNSDKRLKERDGKPKKAQPDHMEHIPFKLREIMKSKDRMKSGSVKAKKVKEGEQTSFFDITSCDAKLFFLFIIFGGTCFVSLLPSHLKVNQMIS